MADPLKEIDKLAKGSKEQTSTNDVINFFQKEMEASRKRERKWRREAHRIIDIYEAKRADENSFNILYANTEVLLPVLFSGTPRPIVERAYQDDDPLAKAASEVLERTLKFLIRQRGPYTPFSSLISKAVLSALVPGRGLTQYEYDADIEKKPSTITSDEEDTDLRKAEETEEGEEALGVPKDNKDSSQSYDAVQYETICGCDWRYDKVLMGFAEVWADVPWVAFEMFMDREDLKVNFPDAVNDQKEKLWEKIPVEEPRRRDEETGAAKRDDVEDDNLGTIKGARVYCIWWKTKRKILFYAPSCPDYILKECDDPLGLDGFYNFPAPLTLMVKYNPQVPAPLYKFYEQQAKELNRLSKRINRLCEAIKVRGLYDGTLPGGELKQILAQDDNVMIAAKNTQQFTDKPNLANFIWMVPLEPIYAALKECIAAREQCKQVIYEICGIADIMRAQSGPYDTATAVSQKNKWGTLRISKGQGRVQNYIRDSLQIMAQIAGKHFAVETFAAMTNLDYATAQDVEQAQQTMQMVQQQYQQMILAAQQQQAMQPPPQGPIPGQPPQQGQPQGGPPQGGPPQQPQQPQPSPEMQQQMQQAQQVLAKPKWDDIVGLLRNDLLRNYRIDVETDSTLASETQATMEEVNQTMQGLAQMYQSFLPAVQEGALTMPALKQMIITVTRRLPFGKQIEDEVQAMPDQLPQPPEDPKIQTAKIQAQADQAESQAKMKQLEMEGQRKEREHQMELEKMARDAAADQQEHQMRMQEMAMKAEQMQLDTQMKREQAAAARQQQSDEMALRQQMSQHDLAIKQADRVAREQQAGAARIDREMKQRQAQQERVAKKTKKIKVTRNMLGKIEGLEIGDADLH